MTVYADPEFIWRFIVTDIASRTITCLDHFQTARVVTRVLNTPAISTSSVPSDVPNVNIPHTDGDPYVSFSDRLLVGFQREAPGTSHPWVPRFHGILEQIEDEATSDAVVSRLTAYDPWQYLFTKPVLDGTFLLPGKDGITYHATRGNVIALQLLTNAIGADGDNCFLDFTSGTFENTDPVEINFAQGTTVGEAWKQLCDTGTMDIVLDPIYDPVTKPGRCARLSIYARAGTQKNSAIFSWDQPPRSLVGVSRLHDGTELRNKVQFFNDQVDPVTRQDDAASIAKYGARWLLQPYAGKAPRSAVILLAAAQLALRKNGKTTFTVTPTPERSPRPGIDYDIGDRVWVRATTSLREKIAEVKRVYGIATEIDDNARSTVRELLLAPDGDA